MGLGSFINNLLNITASAIGNAVDYSVDYSVAKIKETFEAVKLLASDTKHFVTNTCPKVAKSTADAVYHNNIDEDWDGKYIPKCDNCSEKRGNPEYPCEAIKKGGSDKPNAKEPILASGKDCTLEDKPPVYYINGVNNTPEQNCESTKAIANATCSKVIGVYNRTQGLGTDLLESIGNILNLHPFGGDEPTNSMSKIILEKISPKKPQKPEPITIYAHSQGGLVTREAIFEVKEKLKETGKTDEEVNALMKKYVNIKSFGTAEERWAKGPNHEQFTHHEDLVQKGVAFGDGTLSIFTSPSAVIGDSLDPNPNYEEQINEYNSQFATISPQNRHVVKTKNKDGKEFGIKGGVDAHNMADSYSPALEEQRKNDSISPKCLNCPH